MFENSNNNTSKLKRDLTNSSLFFDNTYIELKAISISKSKLFIDGIAFINEVNVQDYSDIDYKLILKGDTEHVLQLAKGNRPEITKKFSYNRKVLYDKCWFTTFSYKGVDLTNIPNGIYELILIIKSGGFTKKQKLRSKLDVGIEEECFDFQFDSKLGVFTLNSLIIVHDSIEKKNQFEVIKHSNKKKKIESSFIDDSGNKLDSPASLHNCFIRILGNNNTVVIDKESSLKNTFIEILGNNSYIKIGKNVRVSGTLRLGFNCQVVIGNNVSSTNSLYMTCAEETKILIGDDCMFATRNQVRTDDAHAIYDVNTGQRLNLSKD